MSRLKQMIERLVRGRIRASLNECKVLGPAVRPIYSVSARGEPEPHGSCVLFCYNGRHLGLTAAHVLDEHEVGILSIASDQELVDIPRHWFGSPMPATGRREDDPFDLAFFEFEEESAALLSDCLWLTIEDLPMNRELVQPTTFFTIGYPTRFAKLDRRKAHIDHRGQIYGGTEVADNVYRQMGLDPQTHLAIQFDRKKVISADAVKVHAVKPYGSSGGGAFRFDSVGDRRRPPRTNPLVAIMTDWNEYYKVLFGTRIEVFIAQIRRTFGP